MRIPVLCSLAAMIAIVPVTLAKDKDKDGLKKLPDAMQKALAKGKVLELMTVNPEPAPEGKEGDAIDRYAVTKKVAIRLDTEVHGKVLKALGEGLSEPAGAARCFNPRHGIRIAFDKKIYEILICFECYQVQVFENGKRIGGSTIGRGPQAFFNELIENPPANTTKNGDGLKQLPEAFRTALDKAEVLQLMSLVPEKAEGKVDDAVGGYEVRKIAKLKKGDDRAIALILLDEGLREAGGIAKCFNPRHAIRVVHEKKTYELLICFECSQVHLFEDGKQVGDILPISTAPQETYTRTIRNALK